MVTAVKMNNRMAKKDTLAEKSPDGKPSKAPRDPLADHPHLKTTIAQIEKQFGEGSIMPLGGDRSCRRNRKAFRPAACRSTSPSAAGLAAGRIIESSDPNRAARPRSPCTSLAQAQKAGGIAAFIDAEHAFDPSWAKKLGVDLEMLLVSQPSSGEEAMQITEMLVKTNAVDVIVIDSVAALVPQEGTRRRNRRLARRPAGPADEPVAPQAHRRHRQEQHVRDLHQPDPREDRRHVRQPRNDPRRPGAEVLCLLPDRRPPHRPVEGRRRSRRPARAGQGREEQGRPAVPRRRVRHDAHRRHQLRRRHPRHGHGAENRSAAPAPGSATATCSSAKAKKKSASSSKRIPRSPKNSAKKFSPPASSRQLAAGGGDE